MWCSDRTPHALLPLACLCCVAIIVYALVFAFVSVTNTPPTPAKGPRAVDTLKLVIVVSRHGNRRYFTIPNDPYPLNDTRYWQYGLGEITNAGRVQMYELGVKVRQLYDGFLSPTYRSKDLYAASTRMGRTMQSGALVLAGLYPPGGFQVWSKDIRWQPVPLYSDSQDKTEVMIRKDCERFIEERKVALEQFLTDEENTVVFDHIRDYLKPIIGLNHPLALMITAWDTFISEETEGYSLPQWVNKVYPEPLKTMMGKSYVAFFSNNDVMARLIMGTFYRDVVATLMSKVNGTLNPERKMFYYSGHDTSLVVLQYILGIPKSSIIGMVLPGSAIMFELHQVPENHQFYLKVLYIDGGSQNLEPFPLDIPGCGTPTDLHCVVNNTKRFYNKIDYDAECQLNFTSNT